MGADVDSQFKMHRIVTCVLVKHVRAAGRGAVPNRARVKTAGLRPVWVEVAAESAP